MFSRSSKFDWLVLVLQTVSLNCTIGGILMSYKDKLEKLLECYGISWDELRTLNEAQIKAIEVAYYDRYGENIAISFDF